MCSGLTPVPHLQSHASVGSEVFSGMENLDPIAICVPFEEWAPQTESSQDDQAGVCLGQTLCSHGSRTQLLLTGGPGIGQLMWFCWVVQLGPLGRGGLVKKYDFSAFSLLPLPL